MSDNAKPVKLDPWLLEVLVCPNCKGTLRPEGDELLCTGTCGYAYPVRDGIPVLLVDEGRRPATGAPGQ